MSTRWREVRVYLRSVFLLATVAACGQSSGCAGCDADGPAFPDKDKIHSAVQVRLSAPGVQFLEENVEPLISEAVPDGLNFCIPGDGGDLVVVQWGFCNTQPCSDGQLGCEINIGIGGVDLEPIPGEPLADGTPTERAGKLRATVTFDELNAEFDVRASPAVDCSIRLDAPGFPVGVDLDLTTPDPTRYLTFDLQNPQYRLADLNIRLEGNAGFLSPLCDIIDGALNLPFIGDLFQDLLQTFIDGLLVDLLRGVLEDFTCQACEVDADCPIEEAPRCEGGTCRLEGGACIPAPLGLEGAFDIGELLGGVSPGLSAVLQYFGNPGSYVQVENEGLSVGVIAGAVSERNRCVPRRAQPPNEEPPRSDALRLNESPSGQPFEVGLGVHELTLRHAMWAAYNSGALCLSISGETIEQLSTQFLAIAVPGLRDLAGRDGVMAVTLSPQEVPVFEIGANTVQPDGDGGFELDDPLLTITLPEVWIDFHVFMEGRWARAFSLRADVEVPIGIAFDPDNGIIPVIGDLAGAIRDLETANDEIVPDGAERLVQLLPALIGPILNGALEGLSDPIELPDIMGYQLNLQEGSVTGIDDDTILAIFADLERREEVNMGEGVAARVETDAKVLDVHIPTTAEFVEDGTGVWRRPFVKLALDAWDGSGDGAEMEYSVRVDDHSWSLFSPSRERTVRSPAFILQGRHTIYVRGRRVDDYRTLDPTPTAIEVIIDSIAPEVSISGEDGALVVAAKDMVSPAEAIELAVQIDGGDWQVLDGDRAELPAGAEYATVRATDEAGNAAEIPVAVAELGLIGRLPPDQRGGGEGGCGCSVDDNAPPSGAWWLALVGLLGLRRRRRALAAFAAVFALLGLGGCDDDPPARQEPVQDMAVTDPCDLCAEDQVCQEGMCVTVTCSEDPSVCGNLDCSGGRAAVCNAGLCECEPFCADGCGEGEFCCEQDNACRAVPSPCDQTDCPEGFVPMVEDPGMGDPATCMNAGGACACVEIEPIDAGFVGAYSDLQIVGDSAWVSAYAQTYGDLVVGSFSFADGFDWMWVDGLPDGGELEGAPSGPRGGVTEAGPDVGTHTSLAVGPAGQLHVVYRDEDNDALKYALGQPDNGGLTWRTRTLFSGGSPGRWATVTVDARGVPGVAYQVLEVELEDGSRASELHYMLAKNEAPAGDADWNQPFVVHRIALPDGPVDAGVYPEGTGLFASQARGPGGAPALAWYDRTNGSLWMSRFMDVGFAVPEQLAGWGHPEREGDMGANVDLFIDGDGNAHLCYQDGLTDSLRYLAPELGLDDWVDDGVRLDTGGRGYAVHIVGDDCNVRVDNRGNALIVYQDATGHDLMLARRGGMEPESGWARVSLRGTEGAYQGAFGFYANAEVAGNTLWVSSYVYRSDLDPAQRTLEVLSLEL